MPVLTSTMRMQLDAGGFVKSAAQLAEAVDRDAKKIDALKVALRDSGASDRLQASMQKLGASATHIDGMRRALEQFRKEQGTTGKAWGDLTKEQQAALRTFEGATGATMRAIVRSERDASAAILLDTDERNAALLSKESTLREKLLAEDRKAEDRRIAILAASAAERATAAGREVAARAAIEREITAEVRAETQVREGIGREELATISRIANLEKEARVRAIQAETAALVHAREEQAEALQHAQGKAGAVHMIAGTAAGYVSAHAMVRPAERAIEAGADRQGVLVGMQRAGMSAPEMVRAQDLAVKVARDVGNMTATQVLELHKEARSAVQHPEEVFELMPDLARAASALKGMGAEGNIADLVKAGESLGMMSDKEKFRRYLDSQIRAMSVMGKTINTEQLYEAAKYEKSTGATVSEEFQNLVMPSLSQELHGSSAGDAVAGVVNLLRGGLAHQHIAVMQLNKMGLLAEPDKIVRAKGSGEIMGYTGKLKDDALLASDPDQWFQKVWNRAAEERMGAVSLADKNLLLKQTVPTKTAANVGRIFIQQADTFAQHRENLRNAPGTEAQIQLQRQDPKVAVQTFNDALDDLGAAVTGPVMGRVGLGLTDLAGYIRSVSDAAKDHPNIALGVGAAATAAGLYASGRLAYYVSTGFGLPSAAGQLTASAAALEAAAGKISAAEAVKAAPGSGAPSQPQNGPGLTSRLLPFAFGLGGLALNAPDITTPDGARQMEGNAAALDGFGTKVERAMGLEWAKRKLWGIPEAARGPDERSMPRFADGGIITGPGGPRGDRVRAMLSPGEAVIPADVVGDNRDLIHSLIARSYSDRSRVGASAEVHVVLEAVDHEILRRIVPPPGLRA